MPHFGLRFLFIYLFNIILLITYLYCFCHNSFLYVCCLFFLLFLFFILFFIFIFFLCVCFHHFFRYTGIFFFKSKCTISLYTETEIHYFNVHVCITTNQSNLLLRWWCRLPHPSCRTILRSRLFRPWKSVSALKTSWRSWVVGSWCLTV